MGGGWGCKEEIVTCLEILAAVTKIRNPPEIGKLYLPFTTESKKLPLPALV
jgi:hypothetical protein